MLHYCIAGLVFGVGYVACQQTNRPHIVFILADDLGYNDIGYNARFHSSQISTPFLDELAAKGVRLENYYVQPSCSPSRKQLMTGRFIVRSKKTFRKPLPLENKIISEQLKHCGYDTHMVGKWGLGRDLEYTPLHRGFDSFFGFLSAGSDHYTHENSAGLDLWDNTDLTNRFYGKYSTHIYTERAIESIKNRDETKPYFLYLSYQAVHSPIQVPEYYSNKFSHIKDETRRTYAGMVLALDESVRNVSKQLEIAGMLDNTIFIFSTDNGGTPRYGGNNWPLRGRKGDIWEGGIKAVGFVAGRPLGISGVKSYSLMHITDWFPTLLAATMCQKMNNTQPLDGLDQWNAILQKEESPRTELIHTIDLHKRASGRKVVSGFDTSIPASIRSGPWKLLTGEHQSLEWVPPPESGMSAYKQESNSHQRRNVRLYHIESDPLERLDLSTRYNDIVRTLLQKLVRYKRTHL